MSHDVLLRVGAKLAARAQSRKGQEREAMESLGMLFLTLSAIMKAPV